MIPLYKCPASIHSQSFCHYIKFKGSSEKTSTSNDQTNISNWMPMCCSIAFMTLVFKWKALQLNCDSLLSHSNEGEVRAVWQRLWQVEALRSWDRFSQWVGTLTNLWNQVINNTIVMHSFQLLYGLLFLEISPLADQYYMTYTFCQPS
jgi:hypothetical protein